MPSTRVYIIANLANSTFSLPASRSRRAHYQAHGGVGNGGRRRPGETEPIGREDHGNKGKGRIVGQEDETPESVADDDAQGGQGNVRGTEEEDPAPRHRPVRQEPVVHKAVERPQQYGYGQVFDVLGVPEARPVGRQDDSDYPDEPSPPDRDLHGVEHHVGVGQGEPLRHLPYGVSVRHQNFRQLTLRLNTCAATPATPRESLPGAAIPVGADARAASQCCAQQRRLLVCTNLRVKYIASFAAMLDLNVYILYVHIDSSLYTSNYVHRAKSRCQKRAPELNLKYVQMNLGRSRGWRQDILGRDCP